MRTSSFWLVIPFLGWVVMESLAVADVSFNRDVRPILSDKCFSCHGPDGTHRDADLRLDLASDTTRQRDHGHVVIPGDTRQSLLFQRISASDVAMRMPPADSAKQLSSQEIRILKEWIEQGAKYESHWAFAPISNPMPLKSDSQDPRLSPIDRFVTDAAARQGLRLSPKADKRTLLRRVYLDLIGLLPTPEESNAFASDVREGAYDEVVQRLLDSPHYGERWGRHWLDQARYADSHGYTIDADRVMWPFRDWVIRALNADMPFDQFTIEQLAGDLLPNASTDQLIASGFHRNTLINQEGGTDPEQFRMEAVMDRVSTTGAVWMGLTVGCAQCHTHKFDPISHREYYQLLAFFNQCADTNNVGPTVDVHEGELFMPKELEPKRRELINALTRVNQLLATQDKRRIQWEESLQTREGSGTPKAPTEWRTLELRSAKAELATMTILDDQSVLATQGILRETYIIESARLAPQTRVGSFRLRFLPHDSLPKRGPGLASNGNLVLSGVEAYLGDERLQLVSASADHSQKGFSPANLIDDDPGTGWAINVEPGSKIKMNDEHVVVLALGRPVATSDLALKFVLKHENNNEYNVGRVQFSVAEEVVDALDDPPLLEALMVQETERTSEQKKLISSKFEAMDEPLNAARKEVDLIRTQLGLGPTVKVMVSRDASTPRTTYILKRGDFLQPDKENGTVHPNVLSVLPQLPPAAENAPYSRLDFARWLVSKQNPLTARVTVNRVWMRYFGRGIVATENDFGSQGSSPTHPELLDWLAWDFMQNGWSMKELHRRIVTSETYQQSSHARADVDSIDPLNLLLARQNRMRLDAEIIRDVSLFASGKLGTKIGGPSVHPPQPDGVYAFTQNNKVWQVSQGDNRYRRGMYTMFYRSAPHPMLTTFDSPDFQSVCTKRQRSNTPLQALTMSNDESIYELAGELALRACNAHPGSDSATLLRRVQAIFEFAVCRPPTPTELDRVKAFIDKQIHARPASELRDAELRDAELRDADSMVWTSIARAVMNTDEFVTRE
ncbi:MAG: PSD1 and planctomycete cytochrome C domain-containing protein [Pirellula sp.]